MNEYRDAFRTLSRLSKLAQALFDLDPTLGIPIDLIQGQVQGTG